MTTKIPLPTGSYKTNDPRQSGKRLVNCFAETASQTSMADSKQDQPPISIRRWAGAVSVGSDNTTNSVRGMWQMASINYAVIGPTLYSFDANGAITQVATGIMGTGFVRMCDNTTCLFILIPNSKIAYTYCPALGATAFSQFKDSTFLFYGAIDVWYVDSYMVFLMQNGRGFYNDDGQVVSGVGPITFTSQGVFLREFGTDPFVGGCVDHREILMFGQRTSEGYVDVGNPTFSPFTNAPDSFMPIGCHPAAAYSVAVQDQAVFWVANDRTVRRRNGQTPQRVSNSGIESILENANLGGSYALCPTVAGHPLWIYTMPAMARTIAYDCLTTEWFEIESFGLGYWRALSYINVQGNQYIGDIAAGRIGRLDTTVYDEFGLPLVTTITTQSVYSNHDRISHRRLELVMTAGDGPSLTYSPQVTLYTSNDSGQTYHPQPLRGLGALGQRTTRQTWFNLGQSRDRTYRFRISDPAPTFTVDITAELDGGKW